MMSVIDEEKCSTTTIPIGGEHTHGKDKLVSEN